MEFCSVCGANKRDGVFYVSRTLTDENGPCKDQDGNYIKVFDTAFHPDKLYTRVCKNAKREGCINSSRTIIPSETFEARAKDFQNLEPYMKMVQEIRDGNFS